MRSRVVLAIRSGTKAYFLGPFARMQFFREKFSDRFQHPQFPPELAGSGRELAVSQRPAARKWSIHQRPGDSAVIPAVEFWLSIFM